MPFGLIGRKRKLLVKNPAGGDDLEIDSNLKRMTTSADGFIRLVDYKP